MSDKMTKSPPIRFAGFTDAWEQRKLGEVLIKNSQKNKDLAIENVESISNKTGFTKQTEQFDDYSVASADLSNYYVIREKQFAYNPSRINVGSIAYKDEGEEKSVVSPLYVSFSTTQRLEDSYLWNWVKTSGFERQRQTLSEGGVRDTLSFNQLAEMYLLAPNIEEQQKIGAFVKALDDTITLHQRKLQLLKDTKKSLLQKMFPEDGANVPEIRFEGFTDAWEQRELGEITLKIGSGKTPKGGESSYVLEGIPLLRSQNVYDDLIDLNDVAYITPQTDEEMKNSRVVKNDVLLNITGASIGRSAVYRHSSPANVNQHVCIVRPVEGYSSDFIQLNLTSPKGQQQIDNNQAGGGREGLNFQQIRKMSFTFPSIEEQDQISALLKKLDYLITLHQRELNSLKNLKKSLLQQMFI